MARARRSKQGARRARRPARKGAGAAARPARRPARAAGRPAARSPGRAGVSPSGPWELVIDWRPARVPVLIRSVEASGAEAFTVARAAWWLSPPPPLALPAPDARGRFTFSWSLQPDGGAAAMSLWLRPAGGRRKAAVAASRAVPSGRRWEGKGKAVAAP